MPDLLAQVTDPAVTPFERLVRLMAILRSEQGCNWDRQQTHQSLLPYLIEETYEVVEAVESNQMADLAEELGDLLCQIVFHAQLAAERGDFDINDAAQSIVTKLIHRHPHVFGERQDLDPTQVRDQWEKIKAESDDRASALDGLPGSMPALTMAFRVGEKAGGIGFDWTEAREVIAKLREELDEIEAAMNATEQDKSNALSEEVGDLLFAAASLSRKLHVDPETALKQALKKFRVRFRALEQRVRAARGTFDRYTATELEALWQEIKKNT